MAIQVLMIGLLDVRNRKTHPYDGQVSNTKSEPPVNNDPRNTWTRNYTKWQQALKEFLALGP